MFALVGADVCINGPANVLITFISVVLLVFALVVPDILVLVSTASSGKVITELGVGTADTQCRTQALPTMRDNLKQAGLATGSQQNVRIKRG